MTVWCASFGGILYFGIYCFVLAELHLVYIVLQVLTESEYCSKYFATLCINSIYSTWSCWVSRFLVTYCNIDHILIKDIHDIAKCSGTDLFCARFFWKIFKILLKLAEQIWGKHSLHFEEKIFKILLKVAEQIFFL